MQRGVVRVLVQRDRNVPKSVFRDCSAAAVGVRIQASVVDPSHQWLLLSVLYLRCPYSNSWKEPEANVAIGSRCFVGILATTTILHTTTHANNKLTERTHTAKAQPAPTTLPPANQGLFVVVVKKFFPNNYDTLLVGFSFSLVTHKIEKNWGTSSLLLWGTRGTLANAESLLALSLCHHVLLSQGSPHTATPQQPRFLIFTEDRHRHRAHSRRSSFLATLLLHWRLVGAGTFEGYVTH